MANRLLYYNTLHQLVKCFRVFVNSKSIFYFMEFFFLKKTVVLLISLSHAHHWVNEYRYFWLSYFKNNFNLFDKFEKKLTILHHSLHWQEHRHVWFLRRCFSTTLLILLSNDASNVFSSQHFFFCFFFQIFFFDNLICLGSWIFRQLSSCFRVWMLVTVCKVKFDLWKTFIT